RRGIGSDKRIGYSFIFPGVGYGGSCFPKDVKAIIRTAEEYNYDFKVMKAVEAVNEQQKLILIPKIENHFNHDLKGKTFTLWGLSFKPKTDDMREAPSVEIIKALYERGAKIKAHDPVAIKEAKRIGLEKYASFYDNYYDALKGSDGLILVTEWLDYREPDFEQMKELMNTPVVFDGRNIYQPEKLKAMGFYYYGVGRR
ncbi:MAG: UDP-glucose/GDP-mannose dehydrogenase family protein, partial [Calditrichaeota bacterium]